MIMKGVQIEGRNAILEMLRQGVDFTKLYIEANVRMEERLDEIFRLAEERRIEIERVERARLNEISTTEVHMGVIGEASRPALAQSLRDVIEKCRARNKEPFILIIDEVVYQQNLGAIVRSANAAGVDCIVVPRKRGQGITAEVIRVSMGAAFFTPVIRESIYSALKTLSTEGVRIIGADMDGSVLYHEADLSGGVALVMGGEHKGLSDGIKRRCEQVVRIPIKGMVSSLNVSVSCAVLMYEKLRQDMVARCEKG
jgi:23S rRNA (guanosine2251-2'-O)-methyltransferase